MFKKLSNNNKEALKSSLMVGLAYAGLIGGVLSITRPDYWVIGAVSGLVGGLILGLTTTWYPDE